jgi:hypothetical protein
VDSCLQTLHGTVRKSFEPSSGTILEFRSRTVAVYIVCHLLPVREGLVCVFIMHESKDSGICHMLREERQASRPATSAAEPPSVQLAAL